MSESDISSRHILTSKVDPRTERVTHVYVKKFINLNFQPLEVVSRYRDPQLQVTENLLAVDP